MDHPSDGRILDLRMSPSRNHITPSACASASGWSLGHQRGGISHEEFAVFLYFFVLYFVFAKVSIHYLGATNMMFVAGLMMAVAVEHCGLHHRLPIIIAVIDICQRHLHHYDLAFAMVQELEQCGC